MAGTSDIAKANLNIDTSTPLSTENQQKVDIQKQAEQKSPEKKQVSSFSGFTSKAPIGGGDPMAFQNAINEMRTKMQSDNKLINAKNAVFKHMYDQPLSDEEKASLTPGLQHAISTGNRTLIDAAISDVTAQIKGYNSTIDTNLAAYSDAVARANELKQSVGQNVLDYTSKGVDSNSIASYISNMGMNPEDFGITGKISIPETSRLAFVNNNPGNLKFVGQEGATMGESGFARFESPEAGYAALQQQISLDASRGQTLSQFINKYAPPTENDTALYIQQAQQQLGVSANTPLTQIDLNKLTQFIAQKESGTKMSYGSTSTSEDETPSVVKAWASRIDAGQATLAQVPDEPKGLKNEVAIYLDQKTQGQTSKAVQTTQTALQRVDDLINSPGLSTAVGVKGLFGGILGGWVIPGTEASNFVADLDSLKAMLTIENMGIMKGVLSDSDMKIIKDASTNLNRGMSETKFKKELERIKNILKEKLPPDLLNKESTGSTYKGYTLPY